MGDAYPFPGVTQLETQDQWEEFFSTIGSGVIEGLAASLNSGTRQAVMAAGSALLHGFLKPVESVTGTAIPAASSQNRTDRLVLRLDRSAATAADYIKPVVLTGTPGTATPPALTRTTSGLWDLRIARWTSASNGALTGLVDEREWLGTRVRKCLSTSRPESPQEGDIIRETDTGRWVGWTGSEWVVLYPVTSDSGDTAVPLAAGFTGSCTVRKINSVVHLRLDATWAPADASQILAESTADSFGIQIATVPAGFRPTATEYGPVILPGDRYCQIRVLPTGVMRIWHLSADSSYGTPFRTSISYVS